ncbi:MAG: class I SAM-dependent methyltransferase [Gammaproteobacteria bacterium]|nr:class I SAM-dependent methyltransferase [Gammaproteobacteria bacterium]
MSKIKQGMVNLGKKWDEKFCKFVPFYDEMVNSLISAIPFKPNDVFSAIDLGAGTGEITKRIKNLFPYAKITCLELVEDMLEMARVKLAGYNDITFELGDFKNYQFTKKYDVIFSSLAIHHLEPTDQKALYCNLYKALNNNGIFIHAESVLGANDFLNAVSYQTYYDLITKNISAEELVTLQAAIKTHDNPVKLIDHITWMQEIGFKDIDIIWRKATCAVFCGTICKDGETL